MRPASGIAALLILAVTLFVVVIATQPPQASAKVVELAQLHDELMTGRFTIAAAHSVSQANAQVAEQKAATPQLPAHLAGARVQSCCLTDVQGELLAVARLEENDSDVTLIVAQAPEFAHQMGTLIKIDGRTFFGHRLNGTRMMMANQGDRWLCVMGDRSYDELAKLASQIDF